MGCREVRICGLTTNDTLTFSRPNFELFNMHRDVEVEAMSRLFVANNSDGAELDVQALQVYYVLVPRELPSLSQGKVDERLIVAASG